MRCICIATDRVSCRIEERHRDMRSRVAHLPINVAVWSQVIVQRLQSLCFSQVGE